MRSLLHVVPFTGLAALALAGCQTYQNPAPQPVYGQPAPVQAQPVTQTRSKPAYDPINDPALRNEGNGNGGGGGGGGGDSPGGGGGGSWG